jgi:hypothetical protein
MLLAGPHAPLPRMLSELLLTSTNKESARQEDRACRRLVTAKRVWIPAFGCGTGAGLRRSVGSLDGDEMPNGPECNRGQRAAHTLVIVADRPRALR